MRKHFALIASKMPRCRGTCEHFKDQQVVHTKEKGCGKLESKTVTSYNYFMGGVKFLTSTVTEMNLNMHAHTFTYIHT